MQKLLQRKCNGLVFRWKSQRCWAHTHIQTSDERILPNGTGYITDVGMTGYYDGILGINREEVIKRFITSLPQRHVVPDNGRSVLSGVIIDLDKNGRTKLIERILINEGSSF